MLNTFRMMLKRQLKAIAQRLFSPGEVDALRSFWFERTIATNHRRGLAQIRKQSLSRPKRLNLGSGPHTKDGFLNVDLFPGGDITLDLRRGLPFESDCCELILSENCLEHIDYPEPISYVLRECLRVLKPGGELTFNVPDAGWALNAYREGLDAPYFREFARRWDPEYCTTRMEHINYLFRQGTEHRFAYDFETADKVLRECGFVDIRQRAYDDTLDSKHREVGSLFVSARKRA